MFSLCWGSHGVFHSFLNSSIFMTIAWSSSTGMLLLLVAFSSLAMILSFSLIWGISSVSSYVHLCKYLLWQVVAFWRGPVVSWNAVFLFIRTWSYRDFSYVCVCTLLLQLSCFCLHFSHLQWLSLPVLWRVWSLCQCASLGLTWAWVWSDQVFARAAVTPNCRALSLWGPLRFFVGQWLQSDKMSFPSAVLGLQSDWCVSLSFQNKSHFGEVPATVRAVCILPCFVWTPAKSVLEGADCKIIQGKGEWY